LREGKVLMVRFQEPGREGFWIMPGGGMEPGEGVFTCAERECLEETGLRVRAERAIYTQEVIGADYHHVKFWVLCTPGEGPLHLENRVSEERNVLVEASFLSQTEIASRKVVPAIMYDEFWTDLESGFANARYLGIHKSLL